MFLAAAAGAQNLSPLAPAPDWSRLDAFQETITREDFTRLLQTVYAPDGAPIRIQPNSALIKTGASGQYELRFAATPKPPPRYWRSAKELPPLTAPARPLEGVNIALDPGHLGGKWAQMEERWFQIENSKPVAEGDMTLLVARHLEKNLAALGAAVSMVRTSDEPATSERPETLRKAAAEELKRKKFLFVRERYDGPSDPLKQNSIQWESELLFYRISEIRQRAALVNDKLKPDLTLCLHFNAEPWGEDPAQPRLTDKNHLHVLLNGCYSPAELDLDDVREEMLIRLLERCHDTEAAVAPCVAEALARDTGLPPYAYAAGNARQVPGNPYLWTRNLLANRLYRNPVIYIEAYVMNSKPAFDRIQMGDYEGLRDQRKSIFHEYADALAEGLAAYYGAIRAPK